MEKTGAVTGIALLVIVLMALSGPGGGGGGGGGGSKSRKNFNVYSREQEAEANWAACRYLASINIPPDTLFDALLKLSVSSSESISATPTENYRARETDEFGHMHTADRSAADLGKMLDTGMIVEATPR